MTGSGAPTAGLVYKLVAREDAGGELVGVAKRSHDKTSVGGRKWALRRRGPDGVAEAEVVGIGHEPVDDGDDRPLLVRLVEHGEVVGAEPLEAARARHTSSVAELPGHGPPAVPRRARHPHDPRAAADLTPLGCRA